VPVCALAALLALPIACGADPPAPAAADDLVARVEGEPVRRAEIERLATFQALSFPNHSIDALRGNALAGSLLPRALARARHPREEAAAREKIDLARARLDAGEAFETVAAEMSDALAGERGDLGLLAIGDLDPLLGVEIFESAVGEVRGPVRTRFGWHLLRVSERHEAPRPWETAIHLHQILARIAPDAGADRRLLEALREEAIVEPVDREFFERIRPAALRVRAPEAGRRPEGGKKP